MVRRLLLIIAMLTGLLVALASPVAAQYQPGQPGFILDPPIVEPLGPTTVIGNGCPRGSDITVTIDGVIFGTGTAADDETGAFVIPIVSPEETGDYVVTVTCGTTVMTQILQVVDTACGFAITGTAGSAVTAIAPGFQIGSSYQLIFQSDPVLVGTGTIEADPQTVNFTIPSNAAVGPHTLTIVGVGRNGNQRVLSCPATVVAADVTTTTTTAVAGPGGVTGALPRTGSDSATLLRAGALLLAGGGLLVLVARRSPRLG